MTLHDLFTLTTIEHRHLLLAYVLVAVVQLGYLIWTLRGLLRASPHSDMPDLRRASVSRRP